MCSTTTMRTESSAGGRQKRLKVVFETVLFVDVVAMIDLNESPLNIFRRFRKENPERAHQFFSNCLTEELFEKNCLDELHIEFALATLDDGLIWADCDTPLSKQGAVTKEIKQIRHGDRTPCFVITVESQYYY